jgi:uncharacterized protein (TIGR02147 family)
MGENRMVDIFQYTDYRKFLLDFYEAEKTRNPHFSHRYVAQKVGFTSSGFFSKIIQGKTNISNELALQFVDFLKLKKVEAEYFTLLVFFNQAKSHAEKKRWFEKIVAFSKSKVKVVEVSQYEFFDKWYYVALRELFSFYKFKGDYDELAKTIDPPISPAQAKKGVLLLEKLNLIKKDDNGYYVQTDTLLSTGYDVRSVAINNFQLATLDLAKESIDRFPKEQRDISTLTLSFSNELYSTIHEKLKAFRREVLELVKNDPKAADKVYQVNFQIFPLSRNPQENANEKQ